MALNDIIKKIGRSTAVATAVIGSYLTGYNSADAQTISNYEGQTNTIRVEGEKKPFYSPKDVIEISRKAKLGKHYERLTFERARMIRAQPSESFYRVAGSQTHQIDETWTYTEINNFLDGNAGTFGKNGATDPVAYSGDTVLFKNTGNGIYQTPANVDARFRNNIPGITISFEDGVYLQNDPQVSAGAVFENSTVDVVLTNHYFRNAQLGLIQSGNLDPDSPNYVTNGNFENLEKASVIHNKTVTGDNSDGSVINDANVYRNIDFGTSFNSQSKPVSEQTAWEKNLNYSVSQTNILFSHPTFYFSGGQTASGNRIWRTSLLGGSATDMNGSLLPQEAYQGGGLSVTAGTGNPNIQGNLEYEVGLNPDPSYLYGGTLELTVGGTNVYAAPVTNIYGRPIANSPLIVDGVAFDIAGNDRRHRGAKPIAGDFDLDNAVTNLDGNEMLRVINAGFTESDHELETFDFTGNGLVKREDILGFCATMTYQNPGANCAIIDEIPATSTWAQVVMALLLATGGTLALRRRYQETLDDFDFTKTPKLN